MADVVIIAASDLASVPGAKDKPEADRSYAAQRASAAVSGAWCSPVTPIPDWVKNIAIDLAVDYLVNPTGATSTTRSIDDASRTVRFDGQQSRRSGPFRLTDDERSRLCPRITRRVGSLRLNVPGCRP